jgi:hypothetical protein
MSRAGGGAWPNGSVCHWVGRCAGRCAAWSAEGACLVSECCRVASTGSRHQGESHAVAARSAKPKPYSPMMAEVGVSISGMPGPPLGPSYRMTITAPCGEEVGGEGEGEGGGRGGRVREGDEECRTKTKTEGRQKRWQRSRTNDIAARARTHTHT